MTETREGKPTAELRIVAECHTCPGLSGYHDKPLPLFNAFRREFVTQTPNWHKLAGHDVREVTR